jgi:uncharacterized protein YjdB
MSTRRTQHFFSLPLLFLLALLAPACGDNIEPDDDVVSLSISQGSATISVGMTLTARLDARFDDGSTRNVTTEATWTTSNPAVASVEGPAITAESQGTATITATYGDHQATIAITVNAATLTGIQITPGNPVAPFGIDQQFTATGTFSDGTSRVITDQVTWAATPAAVATINPAGLATLVSVGTATITASSSGIVASTTLRITAATLVSIAITPADQTIDIGASLELTATGTFSDGTEIDLTTQVAWTTSDAALATVTDELGSNGVVTAVAAGTATITASLGTVGTISGTTTVVVNDPNAVVLVSIAVTAAGDVTSVPLGLTVQLTATGTYGDGSTADITDQVTWASSNANITVSNDDGSEGLARGAVLGTADVTATLGTIVSPALVLEATPAAIEDFALGAFAATVAVGEPLLVVATGELSDDTSAPVNERLTWTSSDPLLASVSDVAGSKGVVTGVALGGPVTITATDGTITRTFEVTSVTAARGKLIINEVDYDMPGSPADNVEFVEIVNVGGAAASLENVKIALVNGEATGGAASYDVYDLTTLTSLAPGQALVLGSMTVLTGLPPEGPEPTSIKRVQFAGATQTNRVQNGGPDGIALVSVAGTACTVVDALSYEGAIASATVAGCDGTLNLVEGTVTTVADAASSGSLSRSNRIDTDNAVADWALVPTPTPGL